MCYETALHVPLYTYIPNCNSIDGIREGGSLTQEIGPLACFNWNKWVLERWYRYGASSYTAKTSSNALISSSKDESVDFGTRELTIATSQRMPRFLKSFFDECVGNHTTIQSIFLLLQLIPYPITVENHPFLLRGTHWWLVPALRNACWSWCQRRS